MMKRFSRRKRGAGEGKQSAIDPGEWLPKIVESGIVDVPSLESWTEPGIPETVATIARGERADATQVIVAFSPRSATEATLAGLSAAQFAVAASEFSGVLVIVAPQWPAGARRLLGLLGQTPYAVEPVAAPVLASGRASVEAETGGQVLAVSASQLASRMTSIDGRAAFTRAALGLEGLAAKHGGAVRIGIDRVELVVLARRVAEIRLEGDSAVLETQIGGRVTTSLSGADLASALDGLEGQLRRRLNDRKVREGEEGLRGRVIASLGTGSELRGLRPWPMPGADLDLIDAVGVNGEGDPVVVAVREELEWTALGAVLEAIGPLGSLLPVLFAETAPPLRLGTSRLLFVAERFADGLERALAAMTVAYELRKVSATAGASVDLVSSGAGEGAQSRAPRRGRRRGGRGRSRGGEESSDEASPPTGPAADIAAAEEGEGEGRRGSRSRSAASAESADSAAGGEDDAEDRDENGPGRSRRRRRPRRGRGAAADGAATDGAATDGKARTGRESEEGRSAEGSRPRRARFEEVSLMDLDDAPEPTDDARSTSVADGSAAEGSESGGSGARRSSSRRGRRGGRGDNRRGGADRASSNADDASEEPPKEADAEGVAEEDLVDADDLSEILARLTENEPDFDSSDSTEESFDDEEEIDEDEAQSQRRQARETRRRSKGDDTDRPAARGRAAILVHADRDSLFSATLLARDIRQLEGMWIYPQEELMTFFRSIATDLRDDTPIFVVGFTPSPARDVIQASALYRGRLTWFDRQAWPPEDRVALRDSLGGDAIHGGEGMDSTLPLVLETCARRSRFSDKLVDLATSRFTQHDFERWGRLWRWRAGEIAAKTGDIRSDIAPLLAGRPSDLAKEAALVELPPAPPEVAWVAENDFRLVHFGGHVMVVLEADASLDTHLSARVARERYSATLSLSYRAGESTFILGGDEINGKRALDYVAVAEHLVNKLEWVEARPDSDHVSRFHVRDLDRNPERLEEVIGEIAMGRSLLER
jgi:hypothetical protein